MSIWDNYYKGEAEYLEAIEDANYEGGLMEIEDSECSECPSCGEMTLKDFGTSYGLDEEYTWCDACGHRGGES